MLNPTDRQFLLDVARLGSDISQRGVPDCTQTAREALNLEAKRLKGTIEGVAKLMRRPVVNPLALAMRSKKTVKQKRGAKR